MHLCLSSTRCTILVYSSAKPLSRQHSAQVQRSSLMGNSYPSMTPFRHSQKVCGLFSDSVSWILLIPVIVTGKKINCVQITSEQFIEVFPVPRHLALDIMDAFHSLE